ncbi:MAG: sel1 repeat family protein, partial [Bacteroidales bacterium]|nr:sel1 repeat family protein [Bacteroidales bacterium]
ALANAYQPDGWLSENSDSTIYWFERSANLCKATALNSLGVIYNNGEFVSTDFVKAAEYYKKAVEFNYYLAAVNLGKLYTLGKGVEMNCDTAKKLFQLVYRSNDDDAINSLGQVYEYGSGCINLNYYKAADCYKQAANSGNSSAMDNLGMLYYLGNGVSEDFEKAYEWIYKAAINGDSRGLYHIGAFHYNEIVENHDYDIAYECFELSASKGNNFGKFFLGLMYVDGIGGATKDCNKASNLFKEAVKGSSPYLLYLYGRIYEEGYCVNQDFKQAFYWIQLSAQEDYALSQNKLGYMYENGDGVNRNILKAYVWYSLAADNDNDNATETVKRLERSLTESQKSDALSLKLEIIEKYELGL